MAGLCSETRQEKGGAPWGNNEEAVFNYPLKGGHLEPGGGGAQGSAGEQVTRKNQTNLGDCFGLDVTGEAEEGGVKVASPFPSIPTILGSQSSENYRPPSGDVCTHVHIRVSRCRGHTDLLKPVCKAPLGKETISHYLLYLWIPLEKTAWHRGDSPWLLKP